MADKTNIAWADATFNPWIGCTKVSPGCDNCYAERQNRHRKWAEGWGPGVERCRTKPATWNRVKIWNRSPAKLIGDEWPFRMPRVFCASLADVFDNEVHGNWRGELWTLIRETPNLQWLIVTKRIGNVADMLPTDWGQGYPNVVLLITVVNQAEADRDIPKLLGTPAKRRGLSIEPMLGPIDLTPVAASSYQLLSEWYGPNGFDPSGTQERKTRMTGYFPRLDWVICGGESGKGARPMHPGWIRSLRDQCKGAGVPFFFKQFGEWVSSIPAGMFDEPSYYMNMEGRMGTEDEALADGGHWIGMFRVGSKSVPRLDGEFHQNFPGWR